MKWLYGIVLTLLVAIFYGQASSVFIYGQISSIVLALGYGIRASLITGILGPYFLLNDPKAKSKVIGIVL